MVFTCSIPNPRTELKVGYPGDGCSNRVIVLLLKTNGGAVMYHFDSLSCFIFAPFASRLPGFNNSFVITFLSSLFSCVQLYLALESENNGHKRAA